MRNTFKVFFVIVISTLAVFIIAGCGSGTTGGDAEKKDKLEIVESGISSDKDGNYTYAVVIQNNTDKVLKQAILNVDAFDENGGKLKPLDDWFTVAKTWNIAPGEKGACVTMITQEELESSDGRLGFESIPVEITYKPSFQSSYRKADGTGVNLKIVDYELVGIEEGYSGSLITFKVKVANVGEEDFVHQSSPDGHDDSYIGCNIVFKDGEGKVLGGSEAGARGDNGDANFTIKAGEEEEIEFVGTYWPSESQELYLEAYYYD